MARIPRKPYILQALCDWAEDNGWTPMIVVSSDAPDVQVPQAHVQDGKLTLNISRRAMREREIDANGLRGLARFAGEIERLTVPLDAIEAFLVRETGEGMLLPAEPELPGLDDEVVGNNSRAGGELEKGDKPPGNGGRDRRHLKVIK